MKTFSGLVAALAKSELWKQPDHVVKVFLTMVAFQDHDSIYKGEVFDLCNQSQKVSEEVLDALDILSLSKWVKASEEGWIIDLAGQERMMRSEMKRMRNRRANKNWRAKRRQEGNPV